MVGGNCDFPCLFRNVVVSHTTFRCLGPPSPIKDSEATLPHPNRLRKDRYCGGNDKLISREASAIAALVTPLLNSRDSNVSISRMRSSILMLQIRGIESRQLYLSVCIQLELDEFIRLERVSNPVRHDLFENRAEPPATSSKRLS